MEDTLRVPITYGEVMSVKGINPCFNGRYSQRIFQLQVTSAKTVLILVLMEDTLRDTVFESVYDRGVVLILVLMEDTLRGSHRSLRYHYQSINPCFNGRYSQRVTPFVRDKKQDVLILVLMEDTLRG